MITFESRFRELKRTRGADECWPWPLVRARDGYGAGVGGLASFAHRAVWLHFVGPIEGKLEVGHICHERAADTCPGGKACLHRRCVNPAHLELQTRLRNSRGMAKALKAECVNGHPRTPDNELVGNRGCRACHAEREQVRRDVAPPRMDPRPRKCPDCGTEQPAVLGRVRTARCRPCFLAHKQVRARRLRLARRAEEAT